MNTPRRVRRSVVSACLLLLGSIIVHAASMKEYTNTVLVCSRDDMGFFAGLETVRSPANRWTPSKEPFPVDLAKYTAIAKQQLIQQHGKRISATSLRSVDIRPFYMIDQDLLVPKGGQQAAWYLVFAFSRFLPDGNILNPEDCYVGMMLDGTVLQMRRISRP